MILASNDAGACPNRPRPFNHRPSGNASGSAVRDRDVNRDPLALSTMRPSRTSLGPREKNRAAPSAIFSQKARRFFLAKPGMNSECARLCHAPRVVRGDEPNYPGKSNLLAALIGLQRAADRGGNRGTRFWALVLQGATCGSKCHRGLESYLDPASTGNVESQIARLKCNGLKPGVGKNAVHTLFAGKGEGAWIFGGQVSKSCDRRL